MVAATGGSPADQPTRSDEEPAYRAVQPRPAVAMRFAVPPKRLRMTRTGPRPIGPGPVRVCRAQSVPTNGRCRDCSGKAITEGVPTDPTLTCTISSRSSPCVRETSTRTNSSAKAGAISAPNQGREKMRRASSSLSSASTCAAHRTHSWLADAHDTARHDTAPHDSARQRKKVQDSVRTHIHFERVDLTPLQCLHSSTDSAS